MKMNQVVSFSFRNVFTVLAVLLIAWGVTRAMWAYSHRVEAEYSLTAVVKSANPKTGDFSLTLSRDLFLPHVPGLVSADRTLRCKHKRNCNPVIEGGELQTNDRVEVSIRTVSTPDEIFSGSRFLTVCNIDRVRKLARPALNQNASSFELPSR